jgi:hypothetical protein
LKFQVHLPGQNPVIFHEDDNMMEVVQRAAGATSTLEAFFKANANEKSQEERGVVRRVAHDLLYQEFPQYFVFNKTQKKWKIRERGFALGRMFFAHPTAGDRFYLRLLLTIVRGLCYYLF